MAPGTDDKEQLLSSSWNHSVALFVNGGDQCAKCLNCTPRHPKGLPMQSKGRQERVLCLARSAALLEEMRKALKAYSIDLLGAFTADQGVAICIGQWIAAAILEANMVRAQDWSVVQTLKNAPILLLDERQRDRGDLPPEGVDRVVSRASMSDLVCKLKLVLEGR